MGCLCVLSAFPLVTNPVVSDLLPYGNVLIIKSCRENKIQGFNRKNIYAISLSMASVYRTSQNWRRDIKL